MFYWIGACGSVCPSYFSLWGYRDQVFFFAKRRIRGLGAAAGHCLPALYIRLELGTAHRFNANEIMAVGN